MKSLQKLRWEWGRVLSEGALEDAGDLADRGGAEEGGDDDADER